MESPVLLEPAGIDALLAALVARGYDPVGPTVRDGAIVYDRLRSVKDLPVGWTDEQEAGSYRLKRRDDRALFGYVVGPHSWKKFLFPPSLRLWKAVRSKKGLSFEAEDATPPRFAFLGVRGCELKAIAVQDRVFMGGPYVDANYQARRRDVLIIAVHCGQAAPTCFCSSMGSGPAAGPGWDLALTELLEPRHVLLAEAATDRGREILAALPTSPASAKDVDAARGLVKATEAGIRRRMDPGAEDLLRRNLEHPRWEDVASRCLACANCTMVCPTCFCSTAEEVGDLQGDHAERWRTWDSCFTLSHSYLHGGSVRSSPSSRYRQWLTHKFSTWHGQFGESGCTGCGRCITWCPTKIDVTEEVRAIRETDGAGSAHG